MAERDRRECARCGTTITAADRVTLLHGDLFHEQCYAALTPQAPIALTREAISRTRKTIRETARALQEHRERRPDR